MRQRHAAHAVRPCILSRHQNAALRCLRSLQSLIQCLSNLDALRPDPAGRGAQLEDAKPIPKGLRLDGRNDKPRAFRTELQGDSAIAQTVMIKLVTRLVAWEAERVPWKLVGLEKALYTDFALNAAVRVRLQGVIDRIDYQDGVYHVLDYKTGLDNKRVKSIATLFDREASKRNRAAFQAFFYAWLFEQHLEGSNATTRVVPGLLNTRELFDDGFDARFFVQVPGSRTYAPVDAMSVHRAAWEDGLRQTLEGLRDPAVPFTQTSDEARCSTCPYKGICQRH